MTQYETGIISSQNLNFLLELKIFAHKHLRKIVSNFFKKIEIILFNVEIIMQKFQEPLFAIIMSNLASIFHR